MRRTLRVLASEARVWADGAGVLDDAQMPARRTHEDETASYTVDWTGWLGSDTISTSSWTADNTTLSGASSGTTSATVKATSPAAGTHADLTNTIVTAGGLTGVARFRLYSVAIWPASA